MASGSADRVLKNAHRARFSRRQSGTCPDWLPTKQSLARLLRRRNLRWLRRQAVFNSLPIAQR
jgi:hypothetical protein